MILKHLCVSAVAATFLAGSAALALAQTSAPPAPSAQGSQTTPGGQEQGAGQAAPRRRSTTGEMREREGREGERAKAREGGPDGPRGGEGAATRAEPGAAAGQTERGERARAREVERSTETRVGGEAVEDRGDRVRSRRTIVERRSYRPRRSVRIVRRGPRIVYVPYYRPRRVVCRTRWVRVRTFFGYYVRPVRVCRRIRWR